MDKLTIAEEAYKRGYETGFKEGYEGGYKVGKNKSVKHGMWCWITEDIYGCTNCGATNHCKEVMGHADFNYCPDCGAKMDGDGNG